MAHLTALRNTALCALAAVAVAGCGAVRTSIDSAPPATGAGGPVGSTATAPAATAPATSDATGINQQISSIDNQLNTIAGQLNAANAGLSTSEGDPSQ